MNQRKVGLIMPGGGARAAYQVGVLKGLAEITKHKYETPFPILCGTSAGALNAVALASYEGDLQQSCKSLENLWSELQCDHVYRSDWLGMLRNVWRLLLSLVNAGVAIGRPVALLDNRPLKQLLGDKIDFSGISRNLQSGKLDAICVTAMNYTEGISVSFYQGGPNNADWQRSKRQGIPTPLQLRHLLASTAIPTIFPPQRIGRHYYGDGALRQLTPISPALHLGAEKVLIISTSGHMQNYEKAYKRVHSPAFGQVVGHLMNSAFIDSLETDIERLERTNELLELSPNTVVNQEGRTLRPIDIQIISPSEDIDVLAEKYAADLPSSIRTLMRITGTSSGDGGVNVASYLLFTEKFCQYLLELGYKDAHAQADSVLTFLSK